MIVCPSCREENPERARFCLRCGETLAATSPASEERKVVSVLFVDLVGFTDRSERADPADVRATLRPYHERVKADIEAFGGTVEKFIGDAVMAAFGAPIAHEDDAERAVRERYEAVALVEEFDVLVRQSRWRADSLVPAARVAIGAGSVELAERLLSGSAGLVQSMRSTAALESAAAIVAEERGRADEAALLYGKAERRWHEWGSVIERAYALLGLGRCGGDDRAIEEGMAIFEGLGASPLTPVIRAA